MRGSPHAHCLLWVKDAPKIDNNDDRTVVNFIDKYITAALPEDNYRKKHMRGLVSKLQRHTHSEYCLRGKQCRFGFPKPPAPATIITRKPSEVDSDEKITNAKKVLLSVQNQLSSLDDNQCLSVDDILHTCGISYDAYIEALGVSTKGQGIILKHTPQDMCLNAYNPNLLYLWGGNIDLQYVINEVATVMYVCSYMTKGEKAMGETLKRVSQECKNDDIRTQMNKIKKEFLGKRVLGAPESAMRVLSMWLMKKSRKVVQVNTSMRAERVSLPKTKKQLSQLHDDDEDVFATSLIDRYAARPSCLDKMCLAMFAVRYDVVSSCSDNISETSVDNAMSSSDVDMPSEGINGNPGEKKYIILKNGLGKIIKRKEQAVMRARRYKVHSEPEKYYHSKLILYYPWNNEDELIAGFKSYYESYIAKCDSVRENSKLFNDDCEAFDITDSELDGDIPSSVWDLVAPAVAQDDADTSKLGHKTLQKGCDGEDVSKGLQGGAVEYTTRDTLSKLYSHAAKQHDMSFREYCSNMCSLNNEQREIVMYCRSWCKKYIHNYRSGRKLDGFHIFLSGSGGTGKSHVVKMIQRDMCSLLRNIINPEPDQPIVLITAPTGSAAFNIGGSTVHAAFSLHDKSRAKLTYEKRSLMQLELEHLMLLITDEISMVGFDLFQRMNEAVCGIKGSVNGDWAGICLLAVGDLYQLPPVAVSPIYMNPRKAQTLSDMAPNGREMMQLHELTQIMRQKDNAFAEAFDRIRRCTPEEGSCDDIMLQSR